MCVCVWGGGGGVGEGDVNKVQYGLCEIGELACKQALLFEHQRSESRKNARASGEAAIEPERPPSPSLEPEWARNK